MKHVPLLLTQRSKTHGDFGQNAHHAQELRRLWRASARWHDMPDVQREALDMMATKLSRILSGHAWCADHWQDIAGYAQLALYACEK